MHRADPLAAAGHQPQVGDGDPAGGEAVYLGGGAARPSGRADRARAEHAVPATRSRPRRNAHFRALSVVDRMSIGSGAPNGWQQMVSAALGRLGQLKQGNAEARDSQFIGRRPDRDRAETAEAVRARCARTCLPRSVVEQIRQDPAVMAAGGSRAERPKPLPAAPPRKPRGKKAEDEQGAPPPRPEARRVAELRRNETEAQSRGARSRGTARRKLAQADAARTSKPRTKRARRRAAAPADGSRGPSQGGGRCRTQEGRG